MKSSPSLSGNTITFWPLEKRSGLKTKYPKKRGREDGNAKVWQPTLEID